MQVQFIDNDVEAFIRKLDVISIAKILRTVDLLERFGSHLGMPHSKALGEGFFELRIRGTLDIRIMYVFHRRMIVLLHGFIKKSRKIPTRELQKAHKKVNLLD